MRNKPDNIYDGEQQQKYVKKSKSKGMPRSKHKHVYETVLLTQEFGRQSWTFSMTSPTEVCSICGYIGKSVRNSMYYNKSEYSDKLTGGLNEKALSLPKYYAEDGSKFAVRDE